MSVAKAPPAADETARAAPRSTMGELALRKDMPLVPISSIAGRALVTVIAIMTFLGSLTGGSAVLIASASRDWRQSVTQEMTIQVRPAAGRDIEADVARAAALARGRRGSGRSRCSTGRRASACWSRGWAPGLTSPTCRSPGSSW